MRRFWFLTAGYPVLRVAGGSKAETGKWTSYINVSMVKGMEACMTTTTFDTLEYFEKLKKAGVPEEQAKVQVEVMQSVVKSYDEATRKELATKGDIQDVRNEIAETKHEILKWVLGIALAQTAVIVAVLGAAIAVFIK